VGATVIRKGENVIISDENFWAYTTEQDDLLNWDPSPSLTDKEDVLLDLSISDRLSSVEISAIQASGSPNLNVGWSFNVFKAPFNPKGCDRYALEIKKEGSTAIVMDRGDCTFLQKVRMAKLAGFDLVVVVDSSISLQPRFIPSLLSEKDMEVPFEELIPLVLVLGRQDSALIKRAEKIRISGTKKHERRMVVRGGLFPLKC
jgi:hypothetical protein